MGTNYGEQNIKKTVIGKIQVEIYCVEWEIGEADRHEKRMKTRDML